MVRADPYGIKPLKEVDQDCSNCMKQCDSSKDIVDNVSSFQSFTTKKLKSTTPYMIYLTYRTKCGKQGVESTGNWKTPLSNFKSYIKKSKIMLNRETFQ